MENLIKGCTCPHCSDGVLELAIGNEPYTTDCLICNKCDSTYNLK